MIQKVSSKRTTTKKGSAKTKTASKSRARTKHKPAADDKAEQKSTRDIWKGSITFGLVEIPVALISAEVSTGISFSHLDRRDFSPVGYRRYNKSNDQEVPWSEIVQGYQYAKGEYVVVGKSDLARANPALTQTISIEMFVDAAEIEPIYYEKPYYLEPLKKNSKSYALLRETLRRTNKVGVARVAIRTREHVAVVGWRDDAIVLYLLRFAQELCPVGALDNLGGDSRNANASSKEIEMAERLVADMSGTWEPNEYEDQYQSDLMKVIEGKIEAGEVHALDDTPAPAQRTRRGEVLDLMPLLRKSVEAAQSRPSRSRPTKRSAKPAGTVRRRRSA